MTTVAIRKSDTEVQVDQTVYAFSRRDDADAFLRCVADTSVDECCRSHAPISTRPAVPEPKPDDPDRGSTISPSMGGMP